jgi:Ribonuclease G/E
MPSVKEGETRDEYMERCVPVVMKEGLDNKAAVGKCEGMYSDNYQEAQTAPLGTIREAAGCMDDATDEDGVFKNVKILGIGRSMNGREYPPETIAKAAHLYEGRAVYINHRSRQEFGDAYDRFGTICNVRTAADGLRGDLRYLPSHRMAPVVKDDLRLGLQAFGLSHEVVANGFKDNPSRVAQITKCVRVDLVSEPSSTISLKESVMQEAEKTIKEQIDTAVAVAVTSVKESLGQEIAALKEQIKQAGKYLGPTVMREGTSNATPEIGLIPTDAAKFKEFMRTAH